MNQQLSPPPLETTAEISALIETLVQTERRLAELTAGEVDTVADRRGQTLMLRRSQDALRESETVKMRAVLNALPAIIALLDAHGVIVSVNESWRNFATANGLLSPEDGVGMNYLDACDAASFVPATEASTVAAGIRSVLSGRSKRFSVEYPCHLPHVQRWFLMMVTPRSEDHANGVVVMHLDVTARRQAINSLETSELRFRQMADHITDVFFLQNLDGSEIYYVSPAYEHIWGRTCESLYANPRSWADALHPDDRQYAITQASADSKAKFGHEYRIIRPDGEIRWIHVREFVILDTAGEPYRTAGVCTDVTERKLVTDEFRESEGLKRAILASSLDSIVTIDEEGKIVEFNSSAETTFGWTRAQAKGKAMVELIVPPHLREAHRRGFAHYLATGEGPVLGKRLELTAIRADGTEFPIELAITPISGLSRPMFTGFIRDITVRQANDARLRESESRFRSLTDLSSDWYWEQDEEYRYVGFSGGESSKKWGNDQRVLLGMRRWELTGITPLSHSWDQHKALLDARKPFRNFEYQHSLENGSIRYVSASGEPMFDADGRYTGYRGVATDITERTEAARALHESERRFADMLQNVELVSLMLDRDARITYCNDYLLRLTGWQQKEVIGQDWSGLFLPPEDASMKLVFAKLHASQSSAWHHENEIVTRAGERRIIRWNNSVLRSGSGEVIGTASIGEDITESLRAKEEILRLNADLERRVNERTAELEAANRELEAFDYSIAHDLRAPIRHIEGFSSMLLEGYGDKLDVRGREYLEKLKGAGKRMELLVGDLLALSLVSRCKLNRSDVDVSALAKLVFANLQEAEPAREIECVIGPSLRVNADLGLLRIVLENLIGNALKFTGKQPIARIEFGCVFQDNVPSCFVRDNGAGFDQSYADRLFAPFQRLHAQSEYKGTGIGLATVSRIITRHGGKVWAEGIVNQGATFHFTLPL